MKSERSESKKRKSKRSEKGKGKPKKKGGGQPGNVNACGPHKGGPFGNKNAYRHGGYCSIDLDNLSEEEITIIENFPTDEERMLIDQITLYSIRERRIMKAINKYRKLEEGEEPLYNSGSITKENKRDFKDSEAEQLYEDMIARKVEAGERLPGEAYRLTTTSSATIDLIIRLEKELTTVQRSKNAAIDSLIRLRLEMAKLQGNTRKNNLVHSWAEAVLKSRDEGING